MTKYYLCAGRGTGVLDPSSWELIDLPRDVREIRSLPDAEFVFATPPCDGFTDLPWRPATGKGLDVLHACFWLCRESGAPWLLENSRFAAEFLGAPMAKRGPHWFWGTYDGLIPTFPKVKSKLAGRDPLTRAALPGFLP